MRHFSSVLARLAKSFARSERGNVAMMFAVMSVPLLVAVGGVIDYSRASSSRSEMQDALDATSLALSRQTNVNTMTSAQMSTFATNYFNANFNTGNVINLTVTPTYSSTGPSVTVSGAATVQTTFLNLIGMTGVPINATSTTIWGESRLRVALVLDNTGSMADSGKMDALKTATHNLLAQLKAAANVDGDVYVSIIPFSKDVNAGASNYSQSWVRWDLWDEVNGSCSRSYWSYYTYNNKTDCENAGRTWTADNHNTWNGCITDRDQDYDTKNTAPTTTSTKFPAEEYSNCPEQLMGLTYDWTALNNKVDAMYPNGNTNQAVGLQWGWQTLTASPFTIPAQDPKYTYKQIIIMLTDGLNTQDRWYTSQSSIDARQKIACQNVKDAGFTLYTVQVNTGGDPTSQMLKDCASSTDNFFLLTSASQIVTTFNSIGTALSNLRLKS